ncbi:MAG: DUF418 domain-containing protein [Burkholderiales bacterium]|nr:DUF418 domain-containing protein [Rhodocyclaceae bacterium]MCE2722889.1 DUF418 domain-containing protein [Betaproteobacteria bacterium]
MASNPASVGEREDVIDALRGAALLGILLVNIQSFAWGVSAPSMGVLWDDATVLDSLTIYLTSLFLEYKIYPIFCFCFGYGFAIMAKRWRLASIGDDAVVKQRYQRRLNFMLVLGLSHGSLIWFGDILARYALAGHFLVTYIGKGPRILLRGIKRWGSITVIFTVTGGLLSALSSPPASLTDGEVDEIMKVFDVYARGDYLSTMLPRLYDYMWVLASWLLLFPQAVLIFLSGAFVAQMGWLRAPGNHVKKWRIVLLGSLMVGLPLSIVFANHALDWAADPALIPSTATSLALMLAPLLSPAYIASAALLATREFGPLVVRALAPMGRLALTNYLMQSILMLGILSGAGFGLADQGQFLIALIAVGMWGLQLGLSHLYLRQFQQGPAEYCWRLYTYRTPSAD